MLLNSVKQGIMNGLHTTWTLGKVIFPVTLIVSLLQYTPVLPWLFDKLAPFMSVFGLSGEAAIPLVLGNLLNLYAAIGGILTLELTVKEVFIIAVMLSFSHNLLIETSVALKSGVKLWVVLSVRIGLALVAALIINLVWPGGSEMAQYGLITANEIAPVGMAAIFLAGLQKAVLGALQLAMIVIPLMIGIQILKDLKWLNVFTGWMAPVTRGLGMNENTALVLTAGLIFGLAYGAGVLLQAVKEDGVSKKDATLAFIFLVACHAVVEDTLIFVPLGIPVFPLFIIRLCTAIALTLIVSRIWNRMELAAKRKGISYETKY
ncbi:nucleoside recognition domain-containing protein [Caldifermentibacillus hisashii]|uniref:nucleoside recognition domain-containing protein n=1 Tax=Caldifermentibacillus hisashii TaxID=996558 RepID=UPI002E22DE61|nr:nucleoside recognition domain-containing protein [Caldifermentibacillus hisashii]